MGFLDSIKSSLGGFDPISAGFSAFSANRQNQQNRKSADMAQRFSERMSSTAYQRGMADMKKAGLNPMLAYKQGGASSPGGNMPIMRDVLTPAIQSGWQASQAASDIVLKKVNAELTKTKDILSKNLIPGSEAISLITKNIAGLLGAVDKMYNKGIGGYDEALERSVQGIGDLVKKSKEMGDSTYQSVKGYFMKKLQDMSESAQKFLRESFGEPKKFKAEIK